MKLIELMDRFGNKCIIPVRKIDYIISYSWSQDPPGSEFAFISTKTKEIKTTIPYEEFRTYFIELCQSISE